MRQYRSALQLRHRQPTEKVPLMASHQDGGIRSLGCSVALAAKNALGDALPGPMSSKRSERSAIGPKCKCSVCIQRRGYHQSGTSQSQTATLQQSPKTAVFPFVLLPSPNIHVHILFFDHLDYSLSPWTLYLLEFIGLSVGVGTSSLHYA